MVVGVICTIILLILPPTQNECSKALDEINQSLINAIKETTKEDEN
jgi:hypothetical protein